MHKTDREIVPDAAVNPDGNSLKYAAPMHKTNREIVPDNSVNMSEKSYSVCGTHAQDGP